GALGPPKRRGGGEGVRGADDEEVEGVLRVHPGVDTCGTVPLWRLRNDRRGGRAPPGDCERPTPRPPGHVSDGRPDQAQEVTLDPLAGEVVRDAEDERVVRQ